MNREESPADELVYMVTGIDENGDTHIFVTSDMACAKRRRVTMLDQYSEVKANWLDPL